VPVQPFLPVAWPDLAADRFLLSSLYEKLWGLAVQRRDPRAKNPPACFPSQPAADPTVLWTQALSVLLGLGCGGSAGDASQLCCSCLLLTLLAMPQWLYSQVGRSARAGPCGSCGPAAWQGRDLRTTGKCWLVQKHPLPDAPDAE